MQELRKIIETNIGTINKQIVDTQRKIDELFEEHLNNPMVNNKVEMEMKNNTKHFYYGWLGALESVIEKIKELEEKDKLEFELALDGLIIKESITERDLKADCPF